MPKPQVEQIMASDDLTKLIPEDLQMELEIRFNTLAAARSELIAKQRLAQSAASDAQIAQAQQIKATVDFLTFAAQYSELARNETMLLDPRLDSKTNHIILECFMTGREQRQMATRAKKQIMRQNPPQDDNGEFDDMFEDPSSE